LNELVAQRLDFSLRLKKMPQVLNLSCKLSRAVEMLAIDAEYGIAHLALRPHVSEPSVVRWPTTLHRRWWLADDVEATAPRARQGTVAFQFGRATS